MLGKYLDCNSLFFQQLRSCWKTAENNFFHFLKKLIRKSWDILVTLHCYTSPTTAARAWRISGLGLAINQGCPSCMPFKYTGVCERLIATFIEQHSFFLSVFELEIAKARQKSPFRCFLPLFIPSYPKCKT